MSNLADKLASANSEFQKRMAEIELTRSVGKLENLTFLPEGNHRIVIADIVSRLGPNGHELIRTEVHVEASQNVADLSLVGRRYDLTWLLHPDHFGYSASRAHSFFVAASAGLCLACDPGFIQAACSANSLRGVVLDAQVKSRITSGFGNRPVLIAHFSPIPQTPQAVVRRRVILDPTTVHAEAVLAETIALNPITPEDQAAEWMTLFGELIKQIPDNACHQPVG